MDNKRTIFCSSESAGRISLSIGGLWRRIAERFRYTPRAAITGINTEVRKGTI
jgi:hypothetical protein